MTSRSFIYYITLKFPTRFSDIPILSRYLKCFLSLEVLFSVLGFTQIHKAFLLSFLILSPVPFIGVIKVRGSYSSVVGSNFDSWREEERPDSPPSLLGCQGELPSFSTDVSG